MISNETESRTFSATSNIGNEVVMTLSATYYSSNSLNFGYTINNVELYKENKKEVDNDKKEWEDAITEKVIGDK